MAIILVVQLAVACGGAVDGQISAFSAPATEADADGWQRYVDPPQLARASAAGVFPGDGSPEAAVTHFYASRLRRDKRYGEVLMPTPSDRLERGLAEYDDWTFRGFRLVAKKQTSADSLWVKVWFEIEADGDTDQGTDEVGVRQVDGRWRIESVPT